MIEHNSIRVKYLAVLIGLLRERERFLDEFSTSDGSISSLLEQMN